MQKFPYICGILVQDTKYIQATFSQRQQKRQTIICSGKQGVCNCFHSKHWAESGYQEGATEVAISVEDKGEQLFSENFAHFYEKV